LAIKENTVGCCGQNRAALASHTATAQSSNAQASAAPASLRFVQRRSIVVRGPVTGRRYQFHDGAFTPGIDLRDTVELLKTGYFEKPTG
jgi:hypothetical protein